MNFRHQSTTNLYLIACQQCKRRYRVRRNRPMEVSYAFPCHNKNCTANHIIHWPWPKWKVKSA